MKRRRLATRTIILAVIGIALGYTFYTSFFSETGVVNAGDEAINFILTDLDGNRVELAELEGKGVFLNFWGTYCPPCEREMPYMESQYQKYKQQGVEIIAVNVDESELSVRRFVDRYDLSFPIAIDEGGNVLDAYGIGPLPSTVLIDEHGTVVDTHLGGMTEADIGRFLERIKPKT